MDTAKSFLTPFLAGAILSGAITGAVVYTTKNAEIRELGAARDREVSKRQSLLANPTQQPPPVSPGGIPGDGVYIVGGDIRPGTYRSIGNDYCSWTRLRDAGDTSSYIDSSNGKGQLIVTIQASDGAFQTRFCQPWEKIG